MMNGTQLQNLVSKGLGVAARRLGTPFVVHRPKGPCAPLSTTNRTIKLHAAFSAQDDRFRRPPRYGDAVWFGVFDTLYTRAGDYLCGMSPQGAELTFYIAAQQPLLPAQCIKTNRMVQILRPPTPGVGGYGGMVVESATVILKGWPANLLTQNARITGSLPESKFGNWLVLLPPLPVEVYVGDVVLDDIGRSFLVAAAEQSDLGWRLTVRQVAG